MRNNLQQPARCLAVLLNLTALIAVAACSATPEDKTSGRCTLSCNNPRVGGAEFVVEPLTPTPLSFHCEGNFGNGGATAAVPAPMQVRFRVVELIPPFGLSESPAAATATAGAATTPTTDAATTTTTASTTDSPLLTKRPVAGVGFEPELHGLVSIENSAQEFKLSATKVSSAKYAGIVTPEAEWCSDTCGVITYEFWPKCIASNSNNVTAGVAVQGVAATTPVQFNLTNP